MHIGPRVLRVIALVELVHTLIVEVYDFSRFEPIGSHRILWINFCRRLAEIVSIDRIKLPIHALS